MTPAGPCAPKASPGSQPPPFPRQSRVPQLVPVRPMNWCVRGFHTNSFHSSTTCPQLFFSFWMTILAARGESRCAAGGCGEAGASRAEALHAPKCAGSEARETPLRYAAAANSGVHSHSLWSAGSVEEVRRG